MAGFEEAGVRLDHASTLQQAVDRCLLGAPDLMILDLTLPDGDGFSLVEWLRRQPTLQALPLVVYSSREISEAEMPKLRLGPTRVSGQGEGSAQRGGRTGAGDGAAATQLDRVAGGLRA